MGYSKKLTFWHLITVSLLGQYMYARYVKIGAGLSETACFVFRFFLPYSSY